MLYLVIAIADHRSLWGRFFISVLLGAVLLLAFHTSHVRARGLRRSEWCSSSLADTSNLLQALFNRHGSDGSTFIMFVLVLIAPIVILNRIIRHETVGLETILGAICVYVLHRASRSPGIYAGINDSEPTGFFAQHGAPNNVDFLYFSFVTITTVGYGDLTAGTSTGRVAGDVRGADRTDLPRDPGRAPREHVRRAAAGRRGRTRRPGLRLEE